MLSDNRSSILIPFFFWSILDSDFPKIFFSELFQNRLVRQDREIACVPTTIIKCNLHLKEFAVSFLFWFCFTWLVRFMLPDEDHS